MSCIMSKEIQAALFFKGWFFACAAASAVLMVFALADMIGHQHSAADAIAGSTFISLLVFELIILFTILPSGIFVWIANRLRFQYFLVFAAFGVALARGFAVCFKAPPTLAWQLTVAGFVAGTVYWFVAVRGNHPD